MNVALSTGVFGGLVMLFMCVHRISMMRRRQHPLGDALVAYILINGLVENVIFSPIAAMPTIVWVLALFWWQFDDPAAKWNKDENSKSLNDGDFVGPTGKVVQ